MKAVSYMLLASGVIVAVLGILLFYQAKTPLEQGETPIPGLGTIPFVDSLFKGLASERKMLGLLMALVGAAATISGIVLAAATRRPGSYQTRK